ncbi:Crp/Fnr family transcriptional regulator [Sulfuriferula thiophila]|uniref:Crp/Fnr family transcriptional regulator n=1 Tax=Sulfuriferula thiophila TaxID=1781211 RepID=UPI000F605D7D|nr:cyclic nucleotide-binding domain-containing protein [Sulfuriferula thiophila]
MVAKQLAEHAELAQFMSHQYLCESLTVSEVNTLLNYLTVLHFDNDDIVSDVGDVGDELYFVVKGEIALIIPDGQNEYEVVRSGPGEMLGMMSFFDKRARSARLVAKATDTQLLKLSRAMYKRMKVEHPYIAINIVEQAVLSLDKLFRSVSSDYAQFSHYLYGAGSKI